MKFWPDHTKEYISPSMVFYNDVAARAAANYYIFLIDKNGGDLDSFYEALTYPLRRGRYIDRLLAEEDFIQQQKGKSYIPALVEKYKSEAKIIAQESPVWCDRLKIRGRFDMLEKGPNGLILTDFKGATSVSGIERKKVKYFRQTAFYLAMDTPDSPGVMKEVKTVRLVFFCDETPGDFITHEVPRESAIKYLAGCKKDYEDALKVPFVDVNFVEIKGIKYPTYELPPGTWETLKITPGRKRVSPEIIEIFEKKYYS